MPQNRGRIIAKCKTLCLALSHEALIPSIPAAVRLPNLRLFKCSIPSIQRMMEQRIVMVLHLIYLLPTSQAPLPFRVHLTHLVLLVTVTSWDLEHSERHPPLNLSHLRRHSSFNWHKTSLPLVASSSSLPAAAHPSPFFSNQRRDSGISVGSVLSSNTDSDPGKTQLRKQKHTDNG